MYEHANIPGDYIKNTEYERTCIWDYMKYIGAAYYLNNQIGSAKYLLN